MSGQSLVGYIAQHYDLPETVQLRRMAEGANENYHVGTPDKQYVLRVYTENEYYPRNPDAYRFELHLLRFLNECGIPAVSPVEREDGNLLSVLPVPPDGVRCAALFHRCKGENHAGWFPEFDAARVRRLGEIVADFHSKSDQFQSPYTRHHFDLHYLLDEPLRLLEHRLTRQVPSGLEFFQETAEDIRRRIAELGKEKPVYGVIHGDLHVGNILYDFQSGYCILDFDQCGFGWRAYDVATLMNSVEATVPRRSSEIQRELLAGYRSRRPLTSGEIDAIDVFIKAWTLWDIGETLALSSLWGGHRNDLTEKETVDDYLTGALERLRGLI